MECKISLIKLHCKSMRMEKFYCNRENKNAIVPSTAMFKPYFYLRKGKVLLTCRSIIM